MFVEFVFEQPCWQPWVSCTERHCGTSMWPTLVPAAVFLQLETLKSLKRLKSRTLMSSVLSLWRQRSALFYPERETICGALHAASGGLGMCIQCLWGRCDESDGNVWACVCVCDEQPFCLGSTHQAPGNLCLSQPPLPFHPSHLSDLHSPALISDICLILTT